MLAKAGLTALALTVVTVLLLTFSVVAGPTAALLAAIAASVIFIALWVALPPWLCCATAAVDGCDPRGTGYHGVQRVQG